MPKDFEHFLEDLRFRHTRSAADPDPLHEIMLPPGGSRGKASGTRVHAQACSVRPGPRLAPQCGQTFHSAWTGFLQFGQTAFIGLPQCGQKV